jgi:hypothetical protein
VDRVLFVVECGSPQHGVSQHGSPDVRYAVSWKGLQHYPRDHHCFITASLQATATFAFLAPDFRAIRCPQALSEDQ